MTGPGKLKLGPKVHPQMRDFGTCLRINRVMGRMPVEVIGTFVDGLLSGNAKIVLEDESVVVANIVNGLPDGLRFIFIV